MNVRITGRCWGPRGGGLAIVLAAAILASLSVSRADEPVSARFKLLTWNVQMLPIAPGAPQLNKKQALRAPWIVDYLNRQDYDVIVLEEVIDRKMSDVIKTGLKETYPYVLSVDAKRGISGCLGGILFASRIPLKLVDHVVFKNISGGDALAEKGCLLVEGELAGRKFQIAGTHLQAGDPPTRRKELPEIFEGILQPHATGGVPQILVGDMNIHVDDDDFQTLLRTTETQAFPIDDPSPYTIDRLNSWTPARKKDRGPRHIDHVLLNPRGTGTTVVRQTIQRARHEDAGETLDLSNHYGLVAIVELKP